MRARSRVSQRARQVTGVTGREEWSRLLEQVDGPSMAVQGRQDLSFLCCCHFFGDASCPAAFADAHLHPPTRAAACFYGRSGLAAPALSPFTQHPPSKRARPTRSALKSHQQAPRSHTGMHGPTTQQLHSADWHARNRLTRPQLGRPPQPPPPSKVPPLLIPACNTCRAV